ncbi:hypothetical protein G4Y79_04645 [Phototrophicus methaneseepsis]|uniref:Uncharacterized protein n=1 Tax=Phototrophicus methaneseepsis TaxID=2710758 RepID=A0A7S8EB27_9CHLR|nr:hypothetical protein [Phototrophicus methaneseepsis]QPC83675.1 hypothetical protein G4Y79_04645 [Phototrophicus methaneseepsis]
MPPPQKCHPTFLLFRLLRVADILATFSEHGSLQPDLSSNPIKTLDAEENQPSDSG